MPNAQARRTRKAAATAVKNDSPDTTTESDTDTVTTATETDTVSPAFELAIQPMPEGYKPDRSPAGRTRVPSVFEPVLPGYMNSGWQKQAHDGTVVLDSDGKATAESVKASNAHVIKRELMKAQHFLGLGMDINITATDVEFNVRPLQKREKKAADAAQESEQNGEDTSEDEDNE